MKTNLKLIGIALLCVMAKSSFSQGLIVQGGFNYSKMVDLYNEGDWDLKGTPGFHAGIIYEVPLDNKGLVIAPGIFYTTKGAKVEMEYNSFFGSESYESVLTSNYIEIPILFKRYFNIGNIKCYGGGGPFLSFMTHASNKWKSTSFGESDSGKEQLDLEGENRFETGGMLTVGVELNQIQLGLQYSLGLVGFGGEYGPDEQFYNSVFSISAGYRFPLNK